MVELQKYLYGVSYSATLMARALSFSSLPCGSFFLRGCDSFLSRDWVVSHNSGLIGNACLGTTGFVGGFLAGCCKLVVSCKMQTQRSPWKAKPAIGLVTMLILPHWYRYFAFENW